ncbi:MAG: hypothetical protein QNJ38_24255, partial [Prochloraceae cyanobacterium]|nr:hypothetical protein [Prochloraceae cyanobacterium]
MSGDWEYYTNGDCPNCFGKKKGCRRRKRTNIVHCRYRGAGSPKYYYLRDDALGFGMYQLIEDREAWSEEQRQLSEFEKEQRRLADLEEKRQREAEIAAQYANSLSIEERDRQIRKILDQLWLWPSHLEKLRKRFSVLGLEAKKIDELIKEADCKSVHQWQGLDIPVSDLFPGVRLGGKSLLIQGDGILIPIKNEEGLYIGLQVRLDDAEVRSQKSEVRNNKNQLLEHKSIDDTSHKLNSKIQAGENNFQTKKLLTSDFTLLTSRRKYVWLAGERKRANRPSSHLQNGDLPLSLHLPPDYNRVSNIIGLTEGIGFKGAIAALRLNIPFIGASGGNFTRSAKLLRHYLDFLDPQQSATIVLFADAGSIKNENIIKIYKNTFKLLKKLGYSVKVAWWNQTTKAEGDIDEIETDRLSQIKYISIEKYLKLCEPTLRSNQEGREILADLQKDEYHRQQYQEYRQLKNLTYKPDLEFDAQRLPDLDIEIQGIIAIDSEKATGKTHQVNKLKTKALDEGKIIISITPRVMLAREQAGKLDINYIDDEGYYRVEEVEVEITLEEHRQYGLLGQDTIRLGKRTVIEKKLVLVEKATLADALALCYDSFLKIYPREDWHRVVFIIDEAETGFKHLLTSNTLKNKRSRILAGLEETMGEALNNQGAVILLDADLSDPSLNYVKAFAPSAKITTIVNKHKTPYPWDIDFYSGGQKNKEKVYEQVIDAIAQDKRIAIALDSQKEARALEKMLCEKFPEKAEQLIICDSEFSETKEGKEFIQNINSNLTKKPLFVLAYTPTIYIGVSIDVDAFDLVFGIFTGVLTPSEIRQSLARYRNPVPRIIYCKNVGIIPDGMRSTSVKEISGELFDYNLESLIGIAKTKISKQLGRKPQNRDVLKQLNQMFDAETGEFKCPHSKAYAQFKARENYEKLNLVKLLKLELITEGHNLRDCTKTEAASSSYLAEIKQNKEEISD